MSEETPYWMDDTVPETPRSDDYPAPWKKTTVIGTRVTRVDAYDRVSGSAVFPHDVSLPDMLHGAILRCPHAHAKVLRVDTSKAEKMPGVRAVLTGNSPGADMPWYERRGEFYSRLFDPHCRHEGEEVAAVAAETPLQAVDAIRAIVVEYEILPFVIDDEAALAPGAPTLHEGGNVVGEPRVRERGDLVRSMRPWSHTGRWPSGTETGSPCGTPHRACSACNRPWPAHSTCPWPTCG